MGDELYAKKIERAATNLDCGSFSGSPALLLISGILGPGSQAKAAYAHLDMDEWTW